MSVIDDAARMIRTRLGELDAEREKLERVLGELGSDLTPRRGRPPGSHKPGPKPGRRRAANSKPDNPGRRKASALRIPRAEREQAILAFLKGHPSASAKEIGIGVGTTANYVNNILTGLRKQSRLIRKADGTQVEVQPGASSLVATKPARAKSSARKKSGRKSSGRRRAKKAAAKPAGN